MGTRWRTIKENRISKFFAFIIVALSITGLVLVVQYMQFIEGNLESIVVDQYVDSEHFIDREVMSAFNTVISAAANGTNIPQDVGYRYHITDGESEYANTILKNREGFESAGSRVYYFENSTWYDGQTQNQIMSYYDDVDFEKGYIVFDDSYLEEKQSEWGEGRDALKPRVFMILALTFTGVVFLIYLISVTGTGSIDDEVHLIWIDRIWSEFNLAMMGSVGILWIMFMNELFRGSYILARNIGIRESMTLVAEGADFAAATVIGVLILSLVRKIKAGIFIKHSLIYIICGKFIDLIRSLFDGRAFSRYPTTKALHRRQWTFIVISGALVVLTAVFIVVATPLMLLPVIFEFMIIYWYVKGNNKTFVEINEGFNKSLDEQVKAERMRVDLVTNISHDLKTPLTSIISYVDLLKKEENLPSDVNDYIQILSDKTNRLKDMVSDLFDLAKSTSGNISLEMESLDLKKLIEQTIADMNGEIEKSGHHVIIELPDGPLMVFSDGQKLYRVIQNILGNAIKYALKGTRIFVALKSDNGHAEICIKNTAGYEMNFTASEILQRFARGDRARATEGSGLGLSIAESFTRVTGGRFRISIDGDQFKVVISYPLQLNDSEVS